MGLAASQIGPKGPEGDKKMVTKFHSEAETAFVIQKNCRCGSTCHENRVQAAKSGYFTSAASEMSGQKGIKGPKKSGTKFHSEAETAKGPRRKPRCGPVLSRFGAKTSRLGGGARKGGGGGASWFFEIHASGPGTR